MGFTPLTGSGWTERRFELKHPFLLPVRTERGAKIRHLQSGEAVVVGCVISMLAYVFPVPRALLDGSSRPVRSLPMRLGVA